MKYLISVSYDGSKFWGFQKLKNKITVQAEIEKALRIISKKEIRVKGAGRTDRGVHALNQKCHFNLDIKITPEGLKKALNKELNSYIYISDCKEVNEEFHARFCVTKKQYLYKINLGEYNPIYEDYILQIRNKLDIKKMKKAAKYFLGAHNFRAFVCGLRDNYDCIIYGIKFKREKDILNIYFKGKSFYNRMVRNMVGALIEVGKGKIEPIRIKKLLEEGKYDDSIFAVKPNGLYLFDIKY